MLGSLILYLKGMRIMTFQLSASTVVQSYKAFLGLMKLMRHMVP